METSTEKLIASILEHQSEIEHDIEMLTQERPEIDDVLQSIRDRQQELVSELENVVKNTA